MMVLLRIFSLASTPYVLRPEYHIGDDQLVDRCQPVSSAVSTPENGENVGCTQGPVPLARSLVF